MTSPEQCPRSGSLTFDPRSAFSKNLWSSLDFINSRSRLLKFYHGWMCNTNCIIKDLKDYCCAQSQWQIILYAIKMVPCVKWGILLRLLEGQLSGDLPLLCQMILPQLLLLAARLGSASMQQEGAGKPLCMKTLCKHGEYTNLAVCLSVKHTYMFHSDTNVLLKMFR